MLVVEDVLRELGLTPVDFNNHWRVQASWRNGSNHLSVAVYKDTGAWLDYGNPNGKAQPLFKLVEKMGRKPSDFALDNKTQIAAPQISDASSTIEKMWEPSTLKRLLPHHDFYLQRGISIETLKMYRGGFATKDAFRNRYVFPVFNEIGKISGFAGRWATPDMPDAAAKWKIKGPKKDFIYPYFVSSESGELPFSSCYDDTEDAFLVESIGDSLAMTENGLCNNSVTFGVKASAKLKAFLIRLAVKNIIIGMNNDSEKDVNTGLCGSINLYLQLLDYFDPENLFICLPVCNDFSQQHEQGKWHEWAQKLDKVKSSSVDQRVEVIKKKAFELIQTDDLPKNLLQKVKEL